MILNVQVLWISLILGQAMAIPFSVFPTHIPAGVGLDMALSKGLELVQREDFEREVRRAVVATREEYFRVMEALAKNLAQCYVNLSGSYA